MAVQKSQGGPSSSMELYNSNKGSDRRKAGFVMTKISFFFSFYFYSSYYLDLLVFSIFIYWVIFSVILSALIFHCNQERLIFHSNEGHHLDLVGQFIGKDIVSEVRHTQLTGVAPWFLLILIVNCISKATEPSISQIFLIHSG